MLANTNNMVSLNKSLLFLTIQQIWWFFILVFIPQYFTIAYSVYSTKTQHLSVCMSKARRFVLFFSTQISMPLLYIEAWKKHSIHAIKHPVKTFLIRIQTSVELFQQPSVVQPLLFIPVILVFPKLEFYYKQCSSCLRSYTLYFYYLIIIIICCNFIEKTYSLKYSIIYIS